MNLMKRRAKLHMMAVPHREEKPSFEFHKGVDGIRVKLVSWTEEPYRAIYDMVMATWNDKRIEPLDKDEMVAVVIEALEGRFLGTVLECVNFTFTIEGVSRATTHQLVRTRIGAGFSQQTTRVSDTRHQAARIPKTIANNPALLERYEEFMEVSRDFYAELVDSGIPYQDARFVQPIGIETYIVETINYRALKTLLANRLCNNMQWEINYVAKMMLLELRKKFPLLAKYLKSRCQITGECHYSENLFPPCGRRPYNGVVPDKYIYKRKDNEFELVDGVDDQ